ncbi:MAG: DNA topoisomerase IB [Betaproteobacteria bacterium]
MRSADRSPDDLASAQAQNAAEAAGLKYVTDAEPGIRRKRDGDAFAYVRPDGRAIASESERERLDRLAVPPAYEDVWICPDPRGHLQATGRDARGRKQYRYHPEWRAARDGAKFARMTDFAAALPRLRRRLRRDLADHGLPRDKVLAVVVSLLDATRVRIGNAEYARDNDSYGLTTLRNRHVNFVRDGRLLLRFRGKGGAAHEIAVDDARLVRLVRHCHQLPGQMLFQYIDDAGERRPVDSDQVNAYLKDAMGADFTAKDFRTWGATLRAAAILHATPLPDPATQTAIKGCVAQAVKQVAADLRNTPAVCRKSYINPLVFTAWEHGHLHTAINDNIAGLPRRAEKLVLGFLRQYAARAARLAKTETKRRKPAASAPRRRVVRTPDAARVQSIAQAA